MLKTFMFFQIFGALSLSFMSLLGGVGHNCIHNGLPHSFISAGPSATEDGHNYALSRTFRYHSSSEDTSSSHTNIFSTHSRLAHGGGEERIIRVVTNFLWY